MSDEEAQYDELETDLEIEEEVEDLELKKDQRRVFTTQGDPEVESLHGKYKRGKLVIQPDFQRQFVWDAGKSSRLIESALLDIPLPVVYLSEEQDGQEHVIDGQQRLTAFFSFIDGKFPNGRPFKLSGLKVFKELQRKAFAELEEEAQDKIRYCKIRTITFNRESQTDLKFEVFERLNTGSVSLNDQELRNCIYRGTYNDLIRRLSRNAEFTALLGLKKPDKRMKDVELVLRFAAFYHATYLNYKPPMRSFLNRDMEKHQNISDSDAKELEEAFKRAVQTIKSLLAEHAFKRFYRGDESNPNGRWEPKKFNASLYDVVMYSFSREDKSRIYPRLDSIREAFIHLMTEDQDFIDAIELSTSSVQAVTKRFDKLRMTLEGIVGIQPSEPRCFSLEIKRELYDADPTCQICHQRIQHVDDAAVDHVEQYWMGGRTIPENARLTHRYCNSARPRHEVAGSSQT